MFLPEVLTANSALLCPKSPLNCSSQNTLLATASHSGRWCNILFHLNHEHPRSCQIWFFATYASIEGHENLSICGHPADQPSFSSEAKPLRLDDAIADSAQGISFLKVNQPRLRICWRVAAQRQG